MNAGQPWRTIDNGIALAVRLTPKSSTDRVEGARADSAGAVHLAARVRAVPDKGAANDALVRLIADWLSVPAGTVSIRAGHGSRLKTIVVAGDPRALAAALATRLG
ncbi:MAG: DUF167 family protein [Rhizobiaceae bacterium]